MTPSDIARTAKELTDNWQGPDVDLSAVSMTIMYDGYEQGAKAGIRQGYSICRSHLQNLLEEKDATLAKAMMLIDEHELLIERLKDPQKYFADSRE